MLQGKVPAHQPSTEKTDYVQMFTTNTLTISASLKHLLLCLTYSKQCWWKHKCFVFTDWRIACQRREIEPKTRLTGIEQNSRHIEQHDISLDNTHMFVYSFIELLDSTTYTSSCVLLDTNIMPWYINILIIFHHSWKSFYMYIYVIYNIK